MVNIEKDFKVRLLNDNHSNANVYGFILFTVEHYNMVKAMRDTDFWVALDKISGKSWPIFSVYPLERKIQEFEGNSPNNTIGWMKCVSKETEYNTEALEYFNLTDSASELPCFVIFAIDNTSKDKVYQKTFSIVGKNEDEIKQSLTDIVKAVSDIEANIRAYGTDKELVSPFAAWESAKSLERLEVASIIRKSFPVVISFARFIHAIGRVMMG